MRKTILFGILALSVNLACANDLMKTENYYPNAKYGIGSRYARKNPTIEKVKNNVRLTVHSYDNGPIHMDIYKYGGGIYFERRFEDHPLSVHGGWTRPPVTQQVNDFHGSIESGRLTVTNATIYGVEMHPDNAYDAKDGGDHPYDIYTYTVDGESRYTSIREIEKPKPLPNQPNNPYNPNANGDNNNGQSANNSGEGDNRNHDLAGSNNPNMPNNSPELANNNSSEVPQPQDSYWTDLQNNARDSSALGGLAGFGHGLYNFATDLADMALHPIDTVENIGNTASAIANDPSIVGQAIGEAWDNKVEAYNNAQNNFERGFEIGTPFGELAPALTAAGSLSKAKTAEELATVGKTVGGYGDDLARGMGQYQRGSIGFADDAAGAGGKNNWGSYRPDRELPKDKYGNKIPDSEYPHTQLGTKNGRNGSYTQGREWGYDDSGKLVPKKDIDFTNHGRADHPNPHQHTYTPNATGGTYQRGGAEPLE